VPADDEPPPFNNYLFWYTVVHCGAGVATLSAGYAYRVLMVASGLAEWVTIYNQTAGNPGLWIAGNTLLAIVLAFFVAARLRTVFRQAFLGFIAGSIISVVVRLPLTLGTAFVANGFHFPWNLLAVLAAALAYAVALTALIRRRRRNRLTRRRRAALVEPFT
jgi:hypothetical protein